MMFIIKNYKAFIAFITILVVPMVLASWGFILSTSQTNAKVPLHESRIINLEQLNYRMDERYKFIAETLEQIKINMDKQARQQRLNHGE